MCPTPYPTQIACTSTRLLAVHAIIVFASTHMYCLQSFTVGIMIVGNPSHMYRPRAVQDYSLPDRVQSCGTSAMS